MDTVFVLVGKIGMDNLSTQAKKRLKTLNGLEEKLIHLQNALEEASEADKGRYQAKVDEAQAYMDNYEEDFRIFLDDEYQDFVETQRIAKEKEDAKKAQQTEAEAEKARLAEEEAEKQRLAEEEEAEKQRLAEEEAEKQRLAGQQPPAKTEESKSGIGLGTIIVGGLIAVATFGAVNYFKNK